MSEIRVTIDGELIGNMPALAATVSAMQHKEQVQSKLISELQAEIARLREERKPVAWCVQAAAGSMFHAGTHNPIDAAVLIQCKDETYARMLATVYGCKILAVIEPDEKELPRE